MVFNRSPLLGGVVGAQLSLAQSENDFAENRTHFPILTLELSTRTENNIIGPQEHKKLSATELPPKHRPEDKSYDVA